VTRNWPVSSLRVSELYEQQLWSCEPSRSTEQVNGDLDAGEQKRGIS